MPDGSEFYTVGAVTLKPREAKAGLPAATSEISGPNF